VPETPATIDWNGSRRSVGSSHLGSKRRQNNAGTYYPETVEK
jgi:hypothetical protein